MKPLLQIDSLTVSYPFQDRQVPVVDNISFSLSRGEILAIVGESGCGKSQLSLALMGLVPRQARVTIQPPHRSLNSAMIFQEPLTALNPVLRVGKQVAGALRNGTGRPVRERVIELLDAVGIPAPQERIDSYPHELSGGMRQRVLIAMALALQPDLLIADEPTTALDVTIQAQILELLGDLNRDRGLAIIFITHDIALVREFAHRVMVMYAGKRVEAGPVERVLDHPRHPYTRALLSVATFQKDDRDKFTSIRGAVPLPADYPTGCRFHPRCPLAENQCRQQEPEWVEKENHGWACIQR